MSEASVDPQGDEGQGDAYLVVFDADAAERERVEGLAEELGVPVWAAGPEDLMPGRSDTWESLARSLAVIVCPEVGAHRGLDLIETLAWDPKSASIPTALCLPEAKPAWVRAALAAGASTCLHYPLDPEEVRGKLLVADGDDVSGGDAAAAEETPDAPDEDEASA